MSNAKAVEDSLPTLVQKLKELSKELSPEEREVLGEIVVSAARHTEYVEADDEGRHDKKLYLKPKSSHSTVQMKKLYRKLPQELGFRDDD